MDGSERNDKIKLIAFGERASKMVEQLDNGHVYKIAHLAVEEAWKNSGANQFSDSKVRPDLEAQMTRKTTLLYLGHKDSCPQSPLPIPPQFYP